MVSPKRTVLLKIAGLCGVIGPIISLSFIALAITYSPWFDWFKNALSDLGVGEAALIFNSGLIIGGVLTTILAIGLMRILKKHVLGLVGAFILVLSSISLCAIGVFPESAGRTHFYVSFAFFSLLVISLFLIGATLTQKASQRYLGVFSILAGVVAATAWAVPHEGVAIPEIIASLAGSAWSIVLCIRILQGRIKHSGY